MTFFWGKRSPSLCQQNTFLADFGPFLHFDLSKLGVYKDKVTPTPERVQVYAVAGFVGMLVGAVFYALSYPWVEKHIQPVAALGKIRLPQLTGIPEWGWFTILTVIAGVVFWLLETKAKKAVGPA